MRKVLFIALLLLSATVSAQTIQDTFLGLKLGSELSQEKLKETLSKEYSRSLTYIDESPISIGITNDISFGGKKWDNVHLFIYKPEMKFYAVEFAIAADITVMLKRDYEELLRKLTEKYGEPETVKLNCRRWQGENGTVELEYIIEMPLSDEEKQALEQSGEKIIFHRLSLQYWDKETEQLLRNYNDGEL